MFLAVRVLRCLQREVVAGGQHHIAGADDLRALRQHVVTRGDVYRVAAQAAGHRETVVALVVRGRGLVRQEMVLARLLVHHAVVLFLRGRQRHVVARRQSDAAVLARHRRRGQRQVVACAHHDVATGTQLRALYVFIVVRGDQRVALAHAAVGLRAAVHHGLAIEVVTGLQRQRLARADLRRLQGHIVARRQHHLASALHAAHRMRGLAAALVVACIVGGVRAVRERLRAQGQVVTGHQLGHPVAAGIAHLRRLQGHIATAHHRQHAAAIGSGHVKPGHARDRLLMPAALQRLHCRGHVDVARRTHAQRIHRAHAGAMDVDVASRGQRYLIAADAAAQVLDPSRIQGHQLTASDGAGVGQRTARMRIDIGTGQQRAAAVQIAGAQAQIHLRHQGGGGAAIGQGDGLLHQPDDVAGELGHLRLAQRNARTQVPGLADGGTGIQQRLVLRFVVLVTVEETPAGELADLLAHQLLLVIAVAQALLQRIGRVAHLPEQVVRAQPAAVVGELRVGLHQVMAAGRAQREQAAGGGARVGRAHGDAIRRAAGGVDHPRAGGGGRAADAADVVAGVAAVGLRHRGGDAPHALAGDTDRATNAGAGAGGACLRATHVEVGHRRAIAHVGRVAPLIEVAQIADIDGQRPTADDGAADLPDLLGDGRIAPAAGGAVVGGGDVAETVGAVQRVRQIGHVGVGIATQADDGQIAAGRDAGVLVAQRIGADAHAATGADHRIRAGTGLQHVFDHGLGGGPVVLVVLQLEWAGALRIHQNVIRIGVGVLRNQAHAVRRAGAISVGIPQRVAFVVECGCARFVGGHPGEGIAGAAAHLIRIGIVVIAGEVVERQRSGAWVQPRALAGRPVQRAAREEIRAGLRVDADDCASHLISIRGDVRRVLNDVPRVEVVDLVRAVEAGGAQRRVAIFAIVAPARLIQPHRCQGGGGLGDRHVLTNVVDAPRLQIEIACHIDGGTEVVHLPGGAGGVAIAVQRTADGGIAIAVDQAAVAVGQLPYAQVQPLACGDGAHARRAAHGLGVVEHAAGGDGELVAIDAPGAQVVQHGGL